MDSLSGWLSLCSSLSLTFPSELPSTVALTHSSNTYLSVPWQFACTGFICFSTNNSKASVTLPGLHQPKRKINLEVNLAAAFSAAGRLWVCVQTDTEPSKADLLNYSKIDLIYVCLSNHLGNHRNCSTGKRFPTATSDQRHLESGCGITVSIGIQDRLHAPWLALFAQRNLTWDVKRGNTTKEWGEGKGGQRRRGREGWKD